MEPKLKLTTRGWIVFSVLWVTAAWMASLLFDNFIGWWL